MSRDYGFYSPWQAANEGFLRSLAERELEIEKEADKQRQIQIEDRDYDLRRRGVEIQERREETAANKDRTEAAAVKAQQEQVAQAIATVTNPNVPQQERMKAGFFLDSAGVDPGMINRTLNPEPPKPTTKPVMRIGRNGTMTQIGVADANAHFVNEPAPQRDPQDPNRFKDDPSLPLGTKQWIASIAQRGVPLADARAELSKGWGQQTAAHPRADLAEAGKYLLSLYPAQEDPMDATPRAPLGGAPAPDVSAPVSAPSTSAPPQAAAPAAPVDLDAQATQILKNAGKPVTPANIAYVRKQLGG